MTTDTTLITHTHDYDHHPPRASRRNAASPTTKPFPKRVCKTNNNSRSFSTWRRNMTQDDYVDCIKEEIAKLQNILLDTDVNQDIKQTAIHTMEHLKQLLRDNAKYTHAE